MPMQLNRRELKARARERMGEARPSYRLVTLVYLLLTAGISIAADSGGVAYPPNSAADIQTLPLFLYLLILLYTTIMHFGYRWWALRTYRREESGYGTLIDGFSMAGRVILLELYIYLCVLGWTLLLAIPLSLLLGGLMAAAYSLGTGAALLVLLVLVACVAALSLAISYRYVLAPYLLMDHAEGGIMAAVRGSAAMMRGWKWEYFKLDFSFLGWHILNWALAALVSLAFLSGTIFSGLWGALSDPEQLYRLWTLQLPALGVLLSALIQLPLSLWLTPYQATATAGFYQVRTSQRRPEAPPVWTPFDGPSDREG